MTRFLRAVLAVALSLATTATVAKGADAPAQAGIRALPRIVFLGDSLTAGYGIEKNQAVPALVQKRLTAEGYHYDVVNAGVSGDTSEGGVTRLNWSLQGDVAVLVIELGGNDGLRGLPPSRTRGNLEKIIQTAKARHIAVLLTGMEAPPNYGEAYTSEFRQVFRDVAREQKVAFMPFYLEGIAGNPRLNISDGIHPNPQGARIVADNVWRYLEPLLKQAHT
ncbi:MAG TPA: arylesterase [Vicinamibacterales bacterium]|nr:arylesterase [Vicinamibacterales bacterium]